MENLFFSRDLLLINLITVTFLTFTTSIIFSVILKRYNRIEDIEYKRMPRIQIWIFIEYWIYSIIMLINIFLKFLFDDITILKILSPLFFSLAADAVWRYAIVAFFDFNYDMYMKNASISKIDKIKAVFIIESIMVFSIIIGLLALFSIFNLFNLDYFQYLPLYSVLCFVFVLFIHLTNFLGWYIKKNKIKKLLDDSEITEEEKTEILLSMKRLKFMGIAIIITSLAVFIIIIDTIINSLNFTLLAPVGFILLSLGMIMFYKTHEKST